MVGLEGVGGGDDDEGEGSWGESDMRDDGGVVVMFGDGEVGWRCLCGVRNWGEEGVGWEFGARFCLDGDLRLEASGELSGLGEMIK